jgi:hypothetical protein
MLLNDLSTPLPQITCYVIYIARNLWQLQQQQQQQQQTYLTRDNINEFLTALGDNSKSVRNLKNY